MARADHRADHSSTPGSFFTNMPRGGFWFATYQGALTAELFVELLKKMMQGRTTAMHLIVDGLAAHKKATVREFIASSKGKLTMYVLPFRGQSVTALP